MISSNLSSLLEREDISINKLSKETGIARQTLTSLANNESKGIQFETIDTLLEYFSIEIDELLINETSKIYININVIDDILFIGNKIKKHFPKVENYDHFLFGQFQIIKKTYSSDNFVCFYQPFMIELVENRNGVVLGSNLTILPIDDLNEVKEFCEHYDFVIEQDIENNNKVFRQIMEKIFKSKPINEEPFSRLNSNILDKILTLFEFEENKFSYLVNMNWESSLLPNKYRKDPVVVGQQQSSHVVLYGKAFHYLNYHTSNIYDFFEYKNSLSHSTITS
ncbi:helix-turn-helix domain-containing protein [Vagococcus fluvialis]|uniref:Helix-turn-helix transcriptional regulator n=1 Tax=Vagococcus fluvialis TaxID=2738 RepID=A0A7X6DAT0_9ENTE|nr:helix-turn-helix transcriptional regulator [Vagococcus fluvialis]NKC68962.1 helix-turn-helix transcriptional regulator [Vagococcus fluvialis]